MWPVLMCQYDLKQFISQNQGNEIKAHGLTGQYSDGLIYPYMPPFCDGGQHE